MITSDWSRSDIKEWECHDVLTLKVNFANGKAQIKRNGGQFWDLPRLVFSSKHHYALALHVACRGMKLKLLNVLKLINIEQ